MSLILTKELNQLNKKKSKKHLNPKKKNRLKKKLRKKEKRRVKRKRKRRKNKPQLFRWKPDLITELSISEPQENKLFSDLSQDCVNCTESSILSMDLLKFILLNSLQVHPKEDRTCSTSNTLEERVALLNLLNFTNKCVWWLTSKEYLKSAQFLELKTPSLIVTCASSSVSTWKCQ